MSENNMPAAEANDVEVAEANHYEFAFHVLPTVAEGEVPSVFGNIKDVITTTGAEIFDEEAPERFDLAAADADSFADQLARRSGGAFDVTVGPAVRLWRRARRCRASCRNNGPRGRSRGAGPARKARCRTRRWSKRSGRSCAPARFTARAIARSGRGCGTPGSEPARAGCCV